MSKSSHQQGIIRRYYENRDTIALQNLGEIVSELYLCENNTKAGKLWDRAGKALQHVADAGLADRVQQVMSMRDVAELCRLINELNALGAVTKDSAKQTPGTPPQSAAPNPTTQPSTTAFGPQVDITDRVLLKRAMKAFRKRLKLTKLDEESNLNVGPFSGGAKSAIVAIQPPDSFPKEVWEALVEQGRLKRSGNGFYALVEE